eukprot:703293-Alexandrium_andersonii.AAC.1
MELAWCAWRKVRFPALLTSRALATRQAVDIKWVGVAVCALGGAPIAPAVLCAPVVLSGRAWMG